MPCSAAKTRITNVFRAVGKRERESERKEQNKKAAPFLPKRPSLGAERHVRESAAGVIKAAGGNQGEKKQHREACVGLDPGQTQRPSLTLYNPTVERKHSNSTARRYMTKKRVCFEL